MQRFEPYNMLAQVSLPPLDLDAVNRRSMGQAAPSTVPTGTILFGLLDVASVGISAYHGYKRNNSTGWAIWWGLMGGLFPVITPAIAIAQGLGKRAR